jgi:hypothetical protein
MVFLLKIHPMISGRAVSFEAAIRPAECRL